MRVRTKGRTPRLEFMLIMKEITTLAVKFECEKEDYVLRNNKETG